MIIASI